MGPFKAYDIRGIYKTDLDEDLAYRIGRALPALLGGRRALIGRDARLSSPSLAAELARGLADAGCAVDDMGLASTPMVYFFTASKHYDFSIQVTASHNPPEYNGFKISRAEARPVGYDSGLADLEAAVARPLPAAVSTAAQPSTSEGIRGQAIGNSDAAQPPTHNLSPLPAALTRGTITKVDYRSEFTDFLRKWVPDLSGLKLVVDCSDGMASLVVRDLFGDAPTYVAAKPDGNFPNHAPNPFEPAGRTLIVDTVKKLKADVGVIYDGDADRMMLIDENGDFVRPDLMIAVMAMRFLRDFPGATILHDIRTSRGVTEYLQKAGATTAMWKVGHAFAKQKLRELNAVFGGELAGHYYFRDFFWCDSGELASLVALSEIAAAHKKGIKLSQLVTDISTYANTGELNFKIENKAEVMERLKDHFTAQEKPVALYDFDGYRVEYADWWFNVRLSNTEPYLRLILEARTPALLNEKLAEIKALIGQ